jgi:hypothetical protein
VKKVVVAFLVVILFGSCGLQKRLYTKGFYSSKQQTTKKSVTKDTTAHIALALKSITQFAKENYMPLFAQLGKANKNVLMQSKRTTFATGGCDTIFFGERIKRLGRIVKLTRKTISYLPCNGDDSTIIVMGRREVKKIHFANGRTEPPHTNQRVEKKYNPADYTKQPVFIWATIGLLLTLGAIGIAALFLSVPISSDVIGAMVEVLFLGGLVFSILAIVKIKHADNPKLVKGLFIADMIISGLFLLAILLVLLAPAFAFV